MTDKVGHPVQLLLVLRTWIVRGDFVKRNGKTASVQRIGFGLFSMFLIVSGMFWTQGAWSIFKDGSPAYLIWASAGFLSVLGGVLLLRKCLEPS